ncbi:TetR/AcrR family transcriptional regulator [Pedobacter sp. AW31-3R]|uniref:TetR/AcrR family transcriptional regulator n=1 Tax=Pedobacter sp. AW31-3R TaxID=3445781 RepID=UPI003F9F0351
MARNVEFDENKAIQKAMEVFWKKGYNGASMRDLTEAMQINSSSLYNTIGDKHQLFLRCITNYVHGRMEEASAQASKIKSPLKAIIGMINNCVNTILYSDNHCLAIKTTFELAATDPDVMALLKEDSDFTHRFLSDLIQDAIAQEEMADRVEAHTIADFIISAFTGWHESYIIYKDPIRIKKMARYLISQL